jgi:CHAT domain-containing protein
MPRLKAIRTSILFVFCVSSFCFAQAPTPRPNSTATVQDEEVLRSLTEKYFAALAKKDLDQAMSIWTPLSGQYESMKKKLNELFAANSKIEVEVHNLAVRKIAVDRKIGEATVRVEFETSAMDAKSGAPGAGFGKMQRTLIFSTRDKDTWKLWREAASEIEDLAEALVETKTDDERKALLAANKILQTAELREALMAQGDRFVAEGQVVNPESPWFYLPKDYQRALVSYQLAQSIAEDMADKIGIVDTVQRIGDAHYLQSKEALAMESYKKALAMYETLGDKRGIAHAFHGIGNVYQREGKDDLLIEHCWKVLALRGSLGNNAADQIILAHAHGDIASNYYAEGKYDLALDHFERALALYDAVGDKRFAAMMLWSAGNLYRWFRNRPEVAFDYYKRSLALVEASGKKTTLAHLLLGISRSYLYQGNFGLALEHSQKGLVTFESLGWTPGISMALTHIGNVHYMQDSYELALEYYQKALRQATENKKATKWDIAGALSIIGRTHAMMGNYDLAIENSRKALTIYKTMDEKWTKSVNASISTDIAYVYLKRGEYDLAIQYYQQALTDAADNDSWTKTPALNGMAEIYLRRGDYARALEAASRAVAAFKQGHLRNNALYGLLQSRTIAGRAYHHLNQRAEARQAFDEAISMVEGLRTQVAGGEQERQHFFEGSISPYHAMVEFLMAQNNAAEALTYAERAKARTLLDVLQSGNVNITKAMTPQEKEEERKLVGEMVSLNTQISQERMRPKPDEKRLDDLNARLKKARTEHETFQVKLYVAHPELRAQRGEAPALKLEEAADLLPDPKSALMEYAVTEDRTYLFILTKDDRGKVDLKSYTIDVKAKDLADRTKAFRQQLAKRNLIFRDSSRALYELLLKPAVAQLQGKTAIVIVPDGALWELSFQALQPAANRYLIEDFAISYAPSLTVLREMMKLRDRSAVTNNGRKLLALGNPMLKAETVTRVKSVFRDEKLDPLPEAEREVKALRQLYGPSQSTIYIGADAREERVKSEARQFRVLHLATHGILNDASPMYSQILLSQAAGNPNEDGLLEAWEITKLNLDADLVVLSACETARGRVGAGEGMIGLTWALFVAGTPTSVVSQWKVESASTTELMVEFHRQLQTQTRNSKQPLSTAGALREAALKLLRSNQYRHPFHWAGFVVVGDGR